VIAVEAPLWLQKKQKKKPPFDAVTNEVCHILISAFFFKSVIICHVNCLFGCSEFLTYRYFLIFVSVKFMEGEKLSQQGIETSRNVIAMSVLVHVIACSSSKTYISVQYKYLVSALCATFGLLKY
jgi:hypothetical protein